MRITSNERIDYISLASVLSAFAVVFLHVNTVWPFENTTFWFYSNIIESIFYFAVPVFFMITGALLIDFNKKYDIKTYFSKRIHKTVIPYILWSLFMSIGLAYAHHTNIEFFENIFKGITIYWFFIPLFCIYLCIPVFSEIADEKKKDVFTYIVIIGFIINILIPFIISVFNLKIQYSLQMMVAGNFLIYPLIGYLLNNQEFGKKRLIFYLFALSGLLLQTFGTYYLSLASGTLINTYKGYENLPCFLYSIGIFIFIKEDLNKIMKNTKINKIVTFLSKYTFGVYLIHAFIIEITIILFHINRHQISFIVITPIFYFLISILTVYIIQKIPFMDKIIP